MNAAETTPGRFDFNRITVIALQSLKKNKCAMEYYKEGQHHQTEAPSVNGVSLSYTNESFNQLPVMVELKPVSLGDDSETVQLFNISAMQLNSGIPSSIHYVASQKYQLTAFAESSQDQDEHLRREKPCLCQVCGKRYANPKALKKHQVIHPEVVFDWQCRICNKTFPYKITMSRHLKLHAGEKLFKCENCSKRFETRYALVQHVKLHKSDVPFRCLLCDKPFLKSAEYARHVRTHTGEKPFKCTVCEKSFTTRSSFVKHSEKKHLSSLTL